MAAQITHEVRNPLASIGYAELLGTRSATAAARPGVWCRRSSARWTG